MGRGLTRIDDKKGRPPGCPWLLRIRFAVECLAAPLVLQIIKVQPRDVDWPVDEATEGAGPGGDG
jgi:hypothetical protein